jgi:hypothetical protein
MERTSTLAVSAESQGRRRTADAVPNRSPSRIAVARRGRRLLPVLVLSRRELGASRDARLSRSSGRYRCRCSSSTGEAGRGCAAAATARRVCALRRGTPPGPLVPSTKRLWGVDLHAATWQDALG